jgi:hypothetical protein
MAGPRRGGRERSIDESPTPVDEQLSAEPGDVDSPEIFEPAQTDAAAEEMRFDDDTPLPDDFDFDFDSEPAESGSAAAVEVREAPAEPDTVQVDLAFGEPEDWEDLLGEVDEDELAETEATVIAPDDDEAETGEDEPLPDVDTQFATQAEAMGIDLSGVYAQAEESAEKAAEESAGESTIDDDLIAAAFEAEAKLAEEEPREESADTIIGIEEDADGDSDDEFSDLDLDVDELDDLIEARDKELVASTEEDAKLAAELGLDEELESEDDKPERRTAADRRRTDHQHDDRPGPARHRGGRRGRVRLHDRPEADLGARPTFGRPGRRGGGDEITRRPCR